MGVVPCRVVHIVAATLGCKRTVVDTSWATFRPDCIDRLGKHYSDLVDCLVSGKVGFLGSEQVYDNQ